MNQLWWCLIWTLALPAFARAESIVLEGHLAKSHGLAGLFFKQDTKWCFAAVDGRDGQIKDRISKLAREVRWLTEVAFDAPYVRVTGSWRTAKTNFWVDDVQPGAPQSPGTRSALADAKKCLEQVDEALGRARRSNDAVRALIQSGLDRARQASKDGEPDARAVLRQLQERQLKLESGGE
jgi:hypothetical protein